MYRILVLMMMLASAPIYAGEWSSYTNVSQFYPHSTTNEKGTIYLKFDEMINPGNCSKAGFIALKKSNSLSREILATLLTSITLGKQVGYYVHGCDAHGFPELLHVNMKIQ